MIVGLSGFLDSGKGTVGDILRDKHRFAKKSFADPLKDVVSTIFGWNRALLEGDTKDSREFRERKSKRWSQRFGYDVTPRLMLQKMGTEGGRDVFHPDIWLYALEDRIQHDTNVVVPDVRFPNEIAFLKRLGGVTIRVRRGNEPVWWDTALDQNKNRSYYEDAHVKCQMTKKYPHVHFSEWAWIGQEFDYIIENNWTLDALEKTVDSIIKNYL